MTDNLPENSENLDYDEDAYDNLRLYFPKGSYVISKPGAIFSGTEFGKDWIIEPTDADRHVIGVEFLVQSKTTAKKLSEDSIDYPFETKNINYLAAKTTPVFLHLYHRELKKGYWLWFQDWHIKNFSPKWRSEQGTVTVKFPLSQEISEESVRIIMTIVNDENTKFRVRQAIDLNNRYDPNFTYSAPEFIENHIFTTAIPKHDKASFSFSIDGSHQEALQQAIEYGYAVRIPLIEHDIPDPLESVFPSDGSEETFISIFTPVPNRVVDLNLAFTDLNNNSVLSYEKVRFCMVRYSKKQHEFHGISEEEGIIYAIQADITGHQQADLRFGVFYTRTDDPVILKRCYETIDKLSQAEEVKITYSVTGIEVGTLKLGDLADVSEEIKRFVDALYILKTQFNIELKVPSTFDDFMLMAAEMASQFLLNRKTIWRIESNHISRKLSISSLPSLLKDIKSRGAVYLIDPEPTQLGFSLLGAEFSWEETYAVICVIELKNIKELEALCENPPADMEYIDLDIEIDNSRSFTTLDHLTSFKDGD